MTRLKIYLVAQYNLDFWNTPSASNQALNTSFSRLFGSPLSPVLPAQLRSPLPKYLSETALLPGSLTQRVIMESSARRRTPSDSIKMTEYGTGTDAKIAKITQREMEIIDLALMEPVEVWAATKVDLRELKQQESRSSTGVLCPRPAACHLLPFVLRMSAVFSVYYNLLWPSTRPPPRLPYTDDDASSHPFDKQLPPVHTTSAP
ncbi:uncharacterized protein ARMOST_03840 [Armillaria ostoyae]|uniref:Uncharacterized protein n=1 Tax=Armillaria ostoyae TaxID=47428 RepID=A0A284QVL6_ARMOS|nr:uncharacterized protein ARMOST_03840 [Armillaria ostoyae]